MTKKLILVGVIHTDPFGMKRLHSAISKTKPSDITFELTTEDPTPFLKEDLVDIIAEWLCLETNLNDRSYAKTVKHFLRQDGYEAKLALALEAKYHIHRVDAALGPDHGVEMMISNLNHDDQPTFVKEQETIINYFFQKLHREMKLSKGMAVVLAEYLSYTFLSKKELERHVEYRYTEGFQKIAMLPVGKITLQRDQTIEQRIREIWRNTEGDLLHVGGLYHTHGQYHNLYERLADLQPQRKKLNEF